MATYKYNGQVLVGGIVFKRFELFKFGIGKLNRNELISAAAGRGDALLSPREKGIGNLSVFTFKTDEATLYPVSQT